MSAKTPLRRLSRSEPAHVSRQLYMTQTERDTLKANAEAKNPPLNFSASVVTDALSAPVLRNRLSELEESGAQIRQLSKVLMDHWHSHHSGSLADCPDPICTFGRNLIG